MKNLIKFLTVAAIVCCGWSSRSQNIFTLTPSSGGWDVALAGGYSYLFVSQDGQYQYSIAAGDNVFDTTLTADGGNNTTVGTIELTGSTPLQLDLPVQAVNVTVTMSGQQTFGLVPGAYNIDMVNGMFTPVPVPEPTTNAVFLLGVLILLAIQTRFGLASTLPLNRPVRGSSGQLPCCV